MTYPYMGVMDLLEAKAVVAYTMDEAAEMLSIGRVVYELGPSVLDFAQRLVAHPGKETPR